MKIIDLLNKIANSEEVPEKIYIKQFQLDFIFNGYTYLSDEKEPQNIYWFLHSGALNYEVEILEEEKKIPEKLESYISCGWNGTCKDLKRDELFEDLKKIGNKINEIIDYLQYLKSKGDK